MCIWKKDWHTAHSHTNYTHYNPDGMSSLPNTLLLCSAVSSRLRSLSESSNAIRRSKSSPRTWYSCQCTKSDIKTIPHWATAQPKWPSKKLEIYIFTVITIATRPIIIFRMKITYLPEKRRKLTSLLKTSVFAYDGRSRCQRGCALRKMKLLLPLPLRQLGPVAPLTAWWAPPVNFVSHLLPNEGEQRRGAGGQRPATVRFPRQRSKLGRRWSSEQEGVRWHPSEAHWKP